MKKMTSVTLVEKEVVVESNVTEDEWYWFNYYSWYDRLQDCL